MGSGSLLEFASKRARLAGKSILDSGNPWFVPLDRLRSDAQSRGKSLVSFANYDYLGLSDRPEIKKASAEALERQSLFINRAVVVPGMSMVWELLRHGRVDKHVAFVNLSTGSMQSLPVDPATWKRFGYESEATPTSA